MGRDSDGVPDAPDLCFLCRCEAKRGRVWSHTLSRYIDGRSEDVDYSYFV